jgi:hypothetical protein
MNWLNITTNTITKTVATGGSLIAASQVPPLVYLTAATLGGFFIGVILPAVWSTKPSRRAAALTVLTELLNILRRPRAPCAGRRSR